MPEPTPTQDITREFFKYRVFDVGKLLVFMVDYLNHLEANGFWSLGALKELGGAVVVRLLSPIWEPRTSCLPSCSLGNASSCTLLSCIQPWCIWCRASNDQTVDK